MGEQENIVQCGPYRALITCYTRQGYGKSRGKTYIGGCFPGAALIKDQAAGKIQSQYRQKEGSQAAHAKRVASTGSDEEGAAGFSAKVTLDYCGPVFFAGGSISFPSGNCLIYGGKGEVVAPSTSENTKGTHLRVQFPGNDCPIGCPLTELSRSAPPTTLLGGYRVGDDVFFTGESQTWPDGDRLENGSNGVVVGPATSEEDKRVAVQFPGITTWGRARTSAGITGHVNCFLTALSRLPGGYCVGDEVFYTGAGKTFPDGDRRTYGDKGEAVGPAEGKEVSTHVFVHFPGNAGPINCLLTDLSRSAPPTTLLGGYRVGDEVFYTGAGKTFPDGDRRTYGGKGEVVGPATGEKDNLERVAVRFPGNTGHVNCFLTALSRSAPPTTPTTLPGGYRVGDEVFFTGAYGEVVTVLSRVVYGGKGEVVGPATHETTKDKRVAVLFLTMTPEEDCFGRDLDGTKGEVVGHLDGNAGQAVDCFLTDLSRTAPPTPPRTGDEVFYTGKNYTFPSGNRLVYGAKGEAVGPATSEQTQGPHLHYTAAPVQFPGNFAPIQCRLTELSRAAP